MPKPLQTFDAIPQDLRDDVRRLGSILGEVIAAARGSEFVDTIEEIRSLAKDARTQDVQNLDGLLSRLQSLEDSELVDIARSFNQFLSFANIAEQRNEVRTGEDQLRTDFRRIRNVLGVQSRDAILNTRIEMVLTAHPTEVLRRTLIRKYDRISRILDESDPSADEKLRQLVTEVWHTDEIRKTKPTPIDEAKWGFAVIENSLWEAIPNAIRSIDAFLHESGQESLPAAFSPFHVSTWMGGDRDANPSVTCEVTKEVLVLSRWMAADLFLRDVEELVSSLSMSVCDEHLHQASEGSYEPYRHQLRLLRHRLQITRDWAEGRTPLSSHVIQNDRDLRQPLEMCYDSLVSCGLQRVANGLLLDTLRRAACFGLSLVKIDVRQSVDRHTQVLDELKAYYEQADASDAPFSRMSEVDKQAYLLGELASLRPLFPRDWNPSSEAQEVIDTCRLVADDAGKGIASYIISMAQNPSDVLAVALLLMETGSKEPIPIVPLFESLDDLDRSGHVMKCLFETPWYRDYVQRLDDCQTVMIGYSDSAKDTGQFAAAWAQYRAQENLCMIAKDFGISLTLFHGRGGAIGRGGGPTYEAIMCQPPGAVAGSLRTTEQGEMIRYKLGSPKIAHATLIRYLLATIEATHVSPERISDQERAVLDEAAGLSGSVYRASVGSRDFSTTFHELTPVRELSELAIGSRPARRSANGDIASLRAIPWVFAWTQVRLMIPAWLGTEAALDWFSRRKDTFDQLYDQPFFRMQIDMLEVMVAKVEPMLVQVYATRLADKNVQSVVSDLAARIQTVKSQLLFLLDADELLSGNQSMLDSLAVRNTYLDPLHLLQAELMYRHRNSAGQESEVLHALKVTMAGIATGLRNTG
ncbi:MAG: phosphoenolpyruvate carboxylase [Gammaproteobacteria bacterium]|nr:phosphoenolpyruvate carboxylase [Gammaproteobacteria bacterium]